MYLLIFWIMVGLSSLILITIPVEFLPIKFLLCYDHFTQFIASGHVNTYYAILSRVYHPRQLFIASYLPIFTRRYRVPDAKANGS